MGYVLTKDSSVSCDHPPTGGGPVDTTATTSVLKVNDSVAPGTPGV